MADSDNTTTLSIVTRSKATAGQPVLTFSPNNSEVDADPAAVVWGKWRATQDEVDRLCRHQQRLEAEHRAGAGGVDDYAAALHAENTAGEQAIELLKRLSQTPAVSLAGVAAKLDVVLGEGQPSEDDDEFPWPLIRSALADLIRIGGLPPLAGAAVLRTGAGNST
ncbi:MAG TPA: hypothetical protein VGV39_11615 [Mesorhizobium sp.]|jgi:hypothetical protein|uniref:hypothetical protein n=1 Tax=Mesorhizobium sp. TaxID=1871066 RepID=UPI002DDD4217|nr:hypothetical protein [Mesorhizobium sp.]HEV2503717.1 hypothetical protein [Mesorhizobium sp.]